MSFYLFAGAALIATLLLASGAGHWFAFQGFRLALRRHGVVRANWVPVLALAVPAMETATGVFALAILAGVASGSLAMMTFATAAAMGVAFVVYLRALLRRQGAGGACGCLPLESPLTPVSFVPGGALVIAGCLGLFALGSPAAVSISAKGVAIAWGLLLAGLVVLLPASMPAPRRTT